jgi:hypothetical protein
VGFARTWGAVTSATTCSAFSFDHLVGERQQHGRYPRQSAFGGLETDKEFVTSGVTGPAFALHNGPAKSTGWN